MRIKQFRVTNYRNVWDSGDIDVNDITAFVGQNEAGKSNLFEALYRINPFVADESYDIDEDWPVDKWGQKDANAVVCVAKFLLDSDEVRSLYDHARIVDDKSESEEAPTEPDEAEAENGENELPDEVTIAGSRTYSGAPTFSIEGTFAGRLVVAKVDEWAKKHAPKFVLIQDVAFGGGRIELDSLAERLKTVGWNDLNNDEQTIKIVLDLAKIDINDLLMKGASTDGRTVRTFDTLSASAYLSQQFGELWTQKDVEFNIQIDATTLNIFAKDKAVGMPVRLNRRSTGFRWHVSFAWKFTHASSGQYKNCILLLEEPGIHLHYAGQRDLLEVFDRLAPSNTILYTTHLASMVDLANPERIRIVEASENHATVRKGVVSSQRAPMAVIELALGLTGDMSGLLGSRQTLIVEGGDDALILYKLSGMLRSAGKPHLSERVYLWPAHGALNTPMFAAFAVGQGWDSGVLLDSDQAGEDAKKKINELVLKDLAEEQQAKFRVMMLGQAAGIKKTDSAIEDLFDEDFYVKCVNAAYHIAINKQDLPEDGSTMITKRVEAVLKKTHGVRELDKRRVMSEVLKQFDAWENINDLPPDTAEKAEKLFTKLNEVFGSR